MIALGKVRVWFLGVIAQLADRILNIFLFDHACSGKSAKCCNRDRFSVNLEMSAKCFTGLAAAHAVGTQHEIVARNPRSQSVRRLREHSR